MSEIIQLYKDKEKTIKVYPKTVASEVYIDEENNIINKFDEINSSLEQKMNKTDKIKSSQLDIASDENKIKQINLSTEVIELIKNPTRSVGTFANGGIYYSADINGTPQVYPSDAKKNVMNKDRLKVSNGKYIIIKANYPIQILVYNYKNGVGNGLTSSDWKDYYEGMEIPLKSDTTEFNITIHKKDGTDINEGDYFEIFQGGQSGYQTFANKSITREKIADRCLTDDQQKQIWGYFIGKDSVVYDTTTNIVTFNQGINLVVDRKEVIHKTSIPSINLNDFNGDMVYVYLNREDNNIYARSFNSIDFTNADTCLLLSFYNGVVNGLDTSSVKVISETSLPSFTVESHWKGKKANFMGDSRVIGSWGGESGNNWHNISRPYPKILGELLGLDTVRNYGIGGTHISSAFNGTDSPTSDAMSKRIEDMDKDADLIVFDGGSNDYMHKDTAPFGSLGDTTDTSFHGAIYYTCKRLRELYPSATIVFVTPKHIFNDDNPNPTTGKTLKDYCNAIKEECELFAIQVVDNYTNIGACPMLESFRNEFMEDGIHGNPTWHELEAKRLYPVYNSIG